MSDASPEIEWYLARDGQQHGPLSDTEMRKFVEFGHLRPTDLVWRQGFEDWRPAASVFPPRPERGLPRPAPSPSHRAPAPAPGRNDTVERREHANIGRVAAREQLPASEPAPSLELAGDDGLDAIERPRRRWGRRLMTLASLLLLLGGGGWFASRHLDKLPGLDQLLLTAVESEPEPPAPPIESLRAMLFPALSDSTEASDEALQKAAVWQVIKREFPEWYAERLKAAMQLKSEQRDGAAITKYLADSIVALRRQNASIVLAAPPSSLRAIAATFLDNLKHFTSYSIDSCYAFISQGETSPQILELMGSADHVQFVQRQVASVFEAVAEARKSPQTAVPPRKTDYDTLTQALTNRGWTQADLQLFSDPRALARAKPETVCKMVQDWFAAQLSIKERDVQVRLLIESLRPVVAG